MLALRPPYPNCTPAESVGRNEVFGGIVANVGVATMAPAKSFEYFEIPSRVRFPRIAAKGIRENNRRNEGFQAESFHLGLLRDVHTIRYKGNTETVPLSRIQKAKRITS